MPLLQDLAIFWNANFDPIFGPLRNANLFSYYYVVIVCLQATVILLKQERTLDILHVFRLSHILHYSKILLF